MNLRFKIGHLSIGVPEPGSKSPERPTAQRLSAPSPHRSSESTRLTAVVKPHEQERRSRVLVLDGSGTDGVLVLFRVGVAFPSAPNGRRALIRPAVLAARP
jgi:hypothetical protein